MIKSILVVCVGNICRSPVGERRLQARLPHLKVESAGIAALVGHPADQIASQVSAENGLFLDGHKARQFTVEMAHGHDLILAMEPGHRKEIVRLGSHLSGKTMLFDHWSGGKGIPDPYQKPRDFHRRVFNDILSAADAWTLRLNGKTE